MYEFRQFPTCATRPTNLILPDVIILVIFDEEYKL
jgi:hypothetical protein